MSITWDNDRWENDRWNETGRDIGSYALKARSRSEGRKPPRQKSRQPGRPLAVGLLVLTGAAAAAAFWVGQASNAPRGLHVAVAELLNSAPAMPESSVEILPAEATLASAVPDLAAPRQVDAAPPLAGQPAETAALAAPQPVPEPVSQTVVAAKSARPPLPEGSVRFAFAAPVADPSRAAGEGEPAIDAANTASIAPGGEVAVAETEADVVAMETELAAAGAGTFSVPREPVLPVTPAPVEQVASTAGGASDMVAGRALKWVNLRDGRSNEAEVLAVVPANAEITAEPGCRHWCAVSWNGRDGYIYRTFIEYDS